MLRLQTDPASALAELPKPAIELHPDATANFDTKAVALLSEFTSAPAEGSSEAATEQQPKSEIIATHLPDHVVRREVEVFRNGDGEVVARSFVHAGMIIGLKDEGYLALRRLAEGLQRTPALRMIVGVDTLEALIFDWARSRLLGSTDVLMSADVLSKLAVRVAEYEVVLPLFHVQIPEPIQIGRITLRTVTSADFAQWESAAVGQREDPADRHQARALLFRERKRMQGFAAAIITLRGERKHVLDIANKEAGEAVSILRLCSPAMLSPRAQSFCTLWGRQYLASTHYLAFQLDRSRLMVGGHVVTANDFGWRIEADRWHLMRGEALDALVQEFYGKTLTDFGEEVKAAVILYSQSALRALSVEKLLGILIPLESLLLRTDSEPITENIAVRLAFAIGETVDERERIVEVVRAVYAMRSAYVHHMRAITGVDAQETLREFMEYAWRFFMSIGTLASSYRERAEYLKTLDRRKLA